MLAKDQNERFNIDQIEKELKIIDEKLHVKTMSIHNGYFISLICIKIYFLELKKTKDRIHLKF